MPTASSLPLDPRWKERLGLGARRSPEFYESGESVRDAPHALALRTAFEDLGLAGVLCVQDVPTVGILTTDTYDRARVVELHGALWNQGLISLLLVISNDTLRAFSLARRPHKDSDASFDQRCLLETLDQTADSLRFANLIQGAESGRLWREHPQYFNPKERIDQVLLENLQKSHELLCRADLSSEAAQALLMQAMFMAYLADRKIITEEYFLEVTGGEVNSLPALLTTRSVRHLKSLFSRLKSHFNGDLFVAPCSFEAMKRAPEVRGEHLDVLARFLEGHEHMHGGQRRFWGYDFRFIPVELVSAVYDRFLGEQEDERRAQGAYYTPMFLADTVVSQVWDLLPPSAKDDGLYLDPACGSGVFLVRSFQRLCEHWRTTHQSRTIRWNTLLAILKRLHGWDTNGSAVRVAVFSLYVALLEEVSPPDIRRLISNGKILPELWNKTLVRQDFFDANPKKERFDVIVGNPPWTSRRGCHRSSVRWCEANDVPMPGEEDAWAFAWKTLRHLRGADSRIALLLPAMGFLHNHADNAVAARTRFLRHSRVHRIINFADLRFQLFEHASSPATLIVYGESSPGESAYRFDYWVPKADLNLQIKRLITLSSADKSSLSTTIAADNPLVFKQRLWMQEPESKLFGYLSRLPKIGALVHEFGTLQRQKQDFKGKWVIGQGFKPFKGQKEPKRSEYVGKLPDLPIGAFQQIAQPVEGLMPWSSAKVHRKGFEAGFEGVRILVPRGVGTAQRRLRASYIESPLTFQDIVQAIVAPPAEKARAKVLAALLNSRVAVWYAFHGTASFGSGRPEVKQAELLRLPFPQPNDLPDPQRAQRAAVQLIALVDDALREIHRPFAFQHEDDSRLTRIDRLTYEYFCLSADETALIEDTVEKVIPAVQPYESNYPDLWKAPTENDRRAYATTLVASSSDWLRPGKKPSVRLEACSADLAILRLCLDDESAQYTEARNSSIADTLTRLSRELHRPLAGNFNLMPDLKVFVENNLYLIKPMQKRFWLRMTALADADAIAMDLQDLVDTQRRRSLA